VAQRRRPAIFRRDLGTLGEGIVYPPSDLNPTSSVPFPNPNRYKPIGDCHVACPVSTSQTLVKVWFKIWIQIAVSIQIL
jgi:hypothetical protein